ncbi:MAG TPA: heterodisulfide reductase-related iron-sulfur binding cluster [Gemmatimonadaceae bacterium]|nr:heterodisulfide reductase-related iron-sulfur binding cluster [Gemmatimonadaceae bacterium]
MTAAGNPRTLHGAPEHCALPDTPLAHARTGLDACVHCGFCLQACPTYVVLEDENDSPRGRLLLMRSLLEGAVSPDDESVRGHLDRCLGCRACETVCPSGVPYGHLLEATRATLTKRHPLPIGARVMLAIFAGPRLMRVAMALGRVARALRIGAFARFLPGRVSFALRMLESTRVPRAMRRGTYEPPAADGPTFALLEGCVMQGLYAATNDATARTLTVNGYRAIPAPGQRCCGALHAHAGDDDAARRLARRNIEAFERSGADYIVSNAAGCGAMMKEYGQLLADDPGWAERARALAARVRDVSELLAAQGPVPGGPLDLRVTYDAPCHLIHAQRISAPPLKVLAAIPGLTLVPLTDAEYCCGAAGIYNLLEPATSDAVLEPKLANIAATGASLVATGNPGCLMQIGAGLRRAGSDARTVHPVDLLDASYARKFALPTSR